MGLSFSKQGNVLSQSSTAQRGAPYALVTGATSGIGRDLATEICRRGLNLIAHGRDPTRLQAVADELGRQFPKCDIRTVVIDAATAFDASGEPTEETRNAIASIPDDLALKVLVNNVGIGHNPTKDFISFMDQTPAQIARLIQVNIFFMTFLTHALLPRLQKAANKGDPSFVINSGSLAELGLPWVSVYSGAKAYISGFSKALDSELRGDSYHVEVVSALIGDTDSDGHKVGTSLFTPSSPDMARMILDSAGTKGPVVKVPYWGHYFQLWLCKIQPYRILQMGMIMNISSLREKNRLASKRQT